MAGRSVGVGVVVALVVAIWWFGIAVAVGVAVRRGRVGGGGGVVGRRGAVGGVEPPRACEGSAIWFRWLPRFSTISPEQFLSPDRLVAAVVAIALGTVDELSGRYLGAWEDIQAVAADAPFIITDDRRVLRIIGS